jgi:endonuclease/exonuclease/phosphatase family metal-dependent hydrolase
MTISLLQLNTNSDNYWNQLTSYLTSHDFDILHLQELTGNHTISGNINSHRNTYAELQKILQEKYYGILSITQRYISSRDAFLGNGTFYKKQFILKDKKEIVLSKFDRFPSDETDYTNVGRILLHLIFEIEGKEISFLNTHFAWGKDPIEKPHQKKQGEILINYLKTVRPPFVLSGDFNLTPDQSLIKKISSLTHNFTTENSVITTLDPENHRAKELFPPGIAVDYIFTSKDITVKNFAVVDEDLSDHFGLAAGVKI